MFFIKYLYYIIGYLRIKVQSAYIERFVNMCKIKGIKIWNSKRKEYNILYTNIKKDDFRKLKPIAKKTNSKIDIKSKKGIPFLVYKYRNRKLFLICATLIIISIYVLSGFVWNIDVTGNKEISKTEIIEALNKEGLYVGIRKNKVNKKDVINKIRLDRSDIAWIGINIKGTNAIVEIKEATSMPRIINEDEYCDIVADKTGMITNIAVQNGTSQVKIRRYSN